VIELPAGGTPVDFAYSLHTDLGHRCRGARVDGAMVTLNTPLKSGQTVEVVAAKEGGPSLDWINAELGFIASHRARAKVRAWFNAQAQAQTIARGRELVEKLLQREGRTALERDSLAEQLGFKDADACSRWWARTNSRCAPSKPCCARRARSRSRPRAPAPPAQRSRRRARWRAGGGHGLAAHHAGALLPPGAAGCHHRLRHAWPGGGGAPPRLQQPAHMARSRPTA
jgi:GTP pyrophosphokinase